MEAASRAPVVGRVLGAKAHLEEGPAAFVDEAAAANVPAELIDQEY